MHVSLPDHRAVAVDDDRAIHLRQLVHELRVEGRVDAHTAGTDLGDIFLVSQHDQRARAAADDVLDARANGSARGNVSQRSGKLGLAFDVGTHAQWGTQ